MSNPSFDLATDTSVDMSVILAGNAAYSDKYLKRVRYNRKGAKSELKPTDFIRRNNSQFRFI